MNQLNENKRVLVVDDNKDIHEDFEKVLQENNDKDEQTLRDLEATLFDTQPQSPVVKLNCEITHAYQGDEALLTVSRAEKEGRPFALIYMDVRMPPGMDGIETIYRIWRQYPFIEMVICTAYSDYSWDEIIAKLGTTDKLLFVKKPFNAVEIKQMTLSLISKWNMNHRLNKLVDNLQEEIQERTIQLNHLLLELREKNQLLQTLSRQDNLTGFLNHGALYEQLNANLSAASRHEFPLIVIMLDIDCFRTINDQYGQQTGDGIITEVARRMRESLRLYDVTLRYQDMNNLLLQKELQNFQVAGRYGGDEFICIIPHCDTAGADTVATRIASKIKEIKLEEAPDLKVTVSIGVCALEIGVKCSDSRNLIKLADKALFMSKEKGSDQITYLAYEE